MDLAFTPDIIPLLIALLLNSSLALYAFRQTDLLHAALLGWVLVSLCIWIYANSAEFIFNGLAAKFLWMKLKYTGAAAVPPLWLAFALLFTGNGKLLTRPVTLLLALWVGLVWFLAFTNDSHQLFIKSVSLIDEASPLRYTPGSLYWFYSSFAFMMIVMASFALFLQAFRDIGLYNQQTVVLLYCGLLPLLGEVLRLLHLQMIEGIDVSIPAFTLTSIVIAWSFFHLRQFDLLPAAQRYVVSKISLGCLVLDYQACVVHINPAACELLDSTPAKAVGRKLEYLVSRWPLFITQFNHASRSFQPHYFEAVFNHRPCMVEISTVESQPGTRLGWVILLQEALSAAAVEPEALPAPQVAPSLIDDGAIHLLSQRQREILAMVARGATYKEIGQALFITEAAVKYHVYRIFVKLNVSTRSEAVAYAVRAGLLER